MLIPPLRDIEFEQAKRAKRSLAAFIRLAWPIIEPGTPLVWNWHIDAICQHLEAVTAGKITRLLINMPPGLMKSTIVSVMWTAWMWALNPCGRFLCSSYGSTPSPALRDSMKTRQIIESDWYRRHFASDWSVTQTDEEHLEVLQSDGWDMADDQNAKSFFQNSRSGFRLALTVGAGTGFRGDGMLVDDPIKAEDAHSKIIRQKNIRWWDETMSSRLNDMATGWRVIIMQRLHDEDLAGHVLQRGGYEHLCLPSEFEPKRRSSTSLGWQDPRTKPGELLFSGKFPQAVLDQAKKDLGADGYAGQHGQSPVADKGSIFEGDSFKRYHTPPAVFDEVIQSWDFTFKGTDGTDFVAGQVWGRRGANCYLLDRVCERMSYTQARQALKDLSAKWPIALKKLVEDKANGPAIIDDLKGVIPGLIAVEPDGDKTARAHAVSPMVQAGNVWIPEAQDWVQRVGESPRPCPWVGDWLHQATHFPKAANDDEVDAMTQALRSFVIPVEKTAADHWAQYAENG